MDEICDKRDLLLFIFVYELWISSQIYSLFITIINNEIPYLPLEDSIALLTSFICKVSVNNIISVCARPAYKNLVNVSL